MARQTGEDNPPTTTGKARLIKAKGWLRLQTVSTAHPTDYEMCHLFAHKLANWFIHCRRIAPSVRAFVLDGHNLDSAAFKQLNLIDARGISTGGNA